MLGSLILLSGVSRAICNMVEKTLARFSEVLRSSVERSG